MKVLIAVDDSTIAEKSFDWYVDKMMKETDEIIICHEAEYPHLPTSVVLADAVSFSPPEINKIISDHQHKLAALVNKFEKKCKAKQIRNYKIIVNTTDSGSGNAIVKRAKSLEAQLIVIGNRGHGQVRRTVLGSVSDYVLHHVKIPVFVCHV